MRGSNGAMPELGLRTARDGHGWEPELEAVRGAQGHCRDGLEVPQAPWGCCGLRERCCRVLAVLCRMGMKCHRVPRDAAGLSVVPMQGFCQQHCPTLCSAATGPA